MSRFTDKTLRDNDRTLLNLNRSEVEKVLPEYFGEDFPNVIQLLEAYYEYLDKNDNFAEKIRDLYLNRDATQVPEELLPFLEDELLLGQAYFGGFLNKREAIKFSNLLYRSKGTKYSVEQFFRGFFGVDPQVIYPKENIFKVGPVINYELDSDNSAGGQIKEEASIIGAESNKFLTDDKLYQVMSVLIRVGIPVKDWIDTYKLFVHPAGVYLGSELLLEYVNTNTLATIQDEVGDPITATTVKEYEATGAFEAYQQSTLLNWVSATHDDGIVRQTTDQSMAYLSDVSLEDSSASLQTIGDLLTINSYTFDKDSDAPDLSQDSDGTIVFKETFDKHRYVTLFDSANTADSAHYPFPHV
jgi:hypothetical protein